MRPTQISYHTLYEIDEIDSDEIDNKQRSRPNTLKLNLSIPQVRHASLDTFADFPDDRSIADYSSTNSPNSEKETGL